MSEASGAITHDARAAVESPPTASGGEILFHTFGGARDTEGIAQRAKSWPHFIGGLNRNLAATALSKGELLAVGPFTLHAGRTRSDANVEAVTLVALDVDGLPAADLPALLGRLASYAAAAHSSPSDGGQGAPLRKLRVYALPSRPMTPGECRAVRLAFAEAVGVTPDRATLNPSCVYFAGHLTDTPPRELWAFDGAPVDVDQLLASASPEITPQANPGGPLPGSGDASAWDARELALRNIVGRILLARRHVHSVKQLRSGPALRVRCPNAAHHDRRGERHTDESAILLPSTGAGSIACMRSSCASITDWLTFATDEELDAAGVTRARVTAVYDDGCDAKGRVRFGATLECVNPDGSGTRVRRYRFSEDTPAAAAFKAATHVEDPRRAVGTWIGLIVDESADYPIRAVHTIEVAA